MIKCCYNNKDRGKGYDFGIGGDYSQYSRRNTDLPARCRRQPIRCCAGRRGRLRRRQRREFPGGKQEAGETAADCLVRECREELGIEIDIVALLEQTSYTYPDNKIGLSFFAAKITGGVPQKSVHQKILWVRPAELLQYQFCPADTEIVSRLAQGE